MKSWTLEKIFKCEEIKFGTSGVAGPSMNGIVVRKNKDCLNFLFEGDESISKWWGRSLGDSGFKFYRPDGSEILPPKDKRKVKLYQFVDEDGNIIPRLYTDDTEKFYEGSGLRKTLRPKAFRDTWIKTNCFIEVEVEE